MQFPLYALSPYTFANALTLGEEDGADFHKNNLENFSMILRES